MSIAEFLAEVKGFQGIDLQDLKNIAEKAEVCTFEAGTYLIRKGGPGDSMHVIMDGRVGVPVSDEQSGKKMVFHLEKGDLVGEMALLTGAPRRADVIAETEVTTVVIDAAMLDPLLGEYPQLARFLTEILGRRLMDGIGIQTVGKYRLLGEIAQGATGKIYAALHPELNRMVAIKMLSHSLVYSMQFKERFLDEARTIASLTHPNIVQVYDTESAYATYFIIMEKLTSPDLSVIMNKRKVLGPQETAGILRQVSAALAYAHSRGFAHRDVKPANVAIDDNGHVKLMDFGLAMPIEKDAHGKKSKTVDGTPHYIAPETAVGKPIDGRVDIYALGVMAFEMVTGRLPFEADNPVDLLKAHVWNTPPDVLEFCPDLPAGLVEFIRGAMIKDPEKRLRDNGKIQRMFDLGGTLTDIWTGASEDVVRIRYLPSASKAVEEAVRTLVGKLGATNGVEVAHGRLEPATPGSSQPLDCAVGE
jgi:CRP-like cAMP-binding protein